MVSFIARSFPILSFVLVVVSVFPSVFQYWAVAQPAPFPEVQNPLIYRPASLSTLGVPPYTPAEIRKAYNFTPLYLRGINGTGTRIAIIDAFGSGSLSTDLANFDSLTGLPTAQVNFYYPDGVPKKPNNNWALETSLDVEWAHAIAPEATIDLVVALDASLQHIYDAIAFVANSLTNETVLSMSFGLSESNYPTTGSFTIAAFHQLFITISSHGTSIFASSGDSGSNSCCNLEYPASDPLVVSVGGTTLTLDSDASYRAETTWSGSTAGASTIFSEPTWQQGLGDGMRDDVDVSYDGDPNSGFLVVKGNFAFQVGGTSAGAPQWAALISLASQANSTRLGNVLPRLYKLTSYHDITQGSNGFFSAGVGWDYPTGLGTPDANATVASLAPGAADVAVTGIVFSRNFTYAAVNSNPILVNITVTNLATVTETFTVTAQANATIVGNQTVTLAPGTTKTLIFNWDTAPLARGKYSVSTRASLVPGETNLTNNSLTSSTLFTVRLAGDVNTDCVVNISDLAIVGSAFGSTPSSSNWNASADINNDGAVNISDLSLVGLHFGNLC